MAEHDAAVAARPYVRHTPWTESTDFAIGLRPIPLEAWFEGGEDRMVIFDRKQAVMESASHLAWAEMPGSRPGQLEALRLVQAAVDAVLIEAPWPGGLHAAALLVSDDLCLMEKRDGEWTLTAASLCAPTFFSAAEAVGKPLSGLHAPVPGFGEKLLHRVSRIFDALAPDVIVERRNWTLLNSGELFLPESAPVRARIPELTLETAGRELHVRVERQTLRRLPETGGALFTIRVWRWPLEVLAQEPARLAAFAEAWAKATPEFRDYKKLHLYDELLAGWLAARPI